MIALALAFLVTAALYASVGFGGGSTYTALLVLSEVDYRILPVISLLCNVIVVTGGTVRYAREGIVPWRRVLPLVLVSAPLAWAGGFTPIRQEVFLAILGVSLLVAGLLLLFQREREVVPAAKGKIVGPVIGGATGYLSGLVGIGGGIFLAPILHFLRWGSAREIAATASFFILVNSIAGIGGQVMKLGPTGELSRLIDWWLLGVAVLIGGQLGSHAGVRLLSQSLVRRATAVLILYVAVQLLWRVLT